jgi:hypothetical protein
MKITYMIFKQMNVKLLLCLAKHNVKHTMLVWWYSALNAAPRHWIEAKCPLHSSTALLQEKNRGFPLGQIHTYHAVPMLFPCRFKSGFTHTMPFPCHLHWPLHLRLLCF